MPSKCLRRRRRVDVDEVDLSLHQIWGLMLQVGEERDVDM